MITMNIVGTAIRFNIEIGIGIMVQNPENQNVQYPIR